MNARPLSTETVVLAGARLARERGLDSLGIRSLAARLRVTPMALYRHLADSEALTTAVLETLLAELPLAPSGGPPLQRLRAHHLLLHWFELPRALEAVESLLAAAEDLGLRGFEAVAAANAVFTFVLMRVELEEALRAGNVMNRKLPALRGLPRLSKNAAEYRVARIDAHFDYGLDLLLKGLGK
jgi:AcrR family transcriptional regulator